jgi:hypothetical protein
MRQEIDVLEPPHARMSRMLFTGNFTIVRISAECFLKLRHFPWTRPCFTTSLRIYDVSEGGATLSNLVRCVLASNTHIQCGFTGLDNAVGALTKLIEAEIEAGGVNANQLCPAAEMEDSFFREQLSDGYFPMNFQLSVRLFVPQGVPIGSIRFKILPEERHGARIWATFALLNQNIESPNGVFHKDGTFIQEMHNSHGAWNSITFQKSEGKRYAFVEDIQILGTTVPGHEPIDMLRSEIDLSVRLSLLFKSPGLTKCQGGHENIRYLVVNRELVTRLPGVENLARAVSRNKCTVILEFDCFEDDAELAALLRAIAWEELGSLTSIHLYRSPVTTASNASSALLDAIKRCSSLFSVSQTVGDAGEDPPIPDSIKKALTERCKQLGGLDATVVSTSDITISEDRPLPSLCFARKSSSLQIDFSGPNRGPVFLHLAHRNSSPRVARIAIGLKSSVDDARTQLYVDRRFTDNPRVGIIQRSVESSDSSIAEAFELSAGMHFKAGERNTIVVQSSSLFYEVQGVQLLPEPMVGYSVVWNTDSADGEPVESPESEEATDSEDVDVDNNKDENEGEEDMGADAPATLL